MNRTGLFLLALACSAATHTAWAFQDIRPGEPMVISGEQLSDFQGVPLDELKLFIWRDCAFEPILFQWDERDPGGSYFDPDDGLLDANDELVFQPQNQLAEAADPSDWLSDDMALAHPRVELLVQDDLTGAESRFYVFRTGAPVSLPTTPVQYDAVNDVVTGAYYQAGFDAGLGIMDQLIFDDGTTNTGDILDREKLRIQGTVILIGSFTLTEQELTNVQITAKAGPVRVIRRLEGTINFLAQSIPVTLVRFFYSEFIGVPDDSAVNIPAGSGVEHIRISFDLTNQASGATWFNNDNADVAIDGTPDSNLSLPILPAQQNQYWSEARLGVFSWVNVGSFAGVAQDINLYYHDDQSGGSGDGTPDTGDGQSYGDHGVRFSTIQAGQVKLAFQSFLLRDYQFDQSLFGMTASTPLVASLQSGRLEDQYDLLVSRWGSTSKNAPDVLYLVRVNDVLTQP